MALQPSFQTQVPPESELETSTPETSPTCPQWMNMEFFCIPPESLQRILPKCIVKITIAPYSVTIGSRTVTMNCRAVTVKLEMNNSPSVPLRVGTVTTREQADECLEFLSDLPSGERERLQVYCDLAFPSLKLVTSATASDND